MGQDENSTKESLHWVHVAIEGIQRFLIVTALQSFGGDLFRPQAGDADAGDVEARVRAAYGLRTARTEAYRVCAATDVA